MTRPTCASCAAWFGEPQRGALICIHRLSPKRLHETAPDDTCDHHTPTAREGEATDGK